MTEDSTRMWQNSIGKVQEGFVEEDYFKRERHEPGERGEDHSTKRGAAQRIESI